VGKPSALEVSFKNMREFMVERNLLYVINVENPLVPPGNLKCVKQLTLDRKKPYI
jgi:hypothetical protein